MNFKELTILTKEVAKKFPGKQWGPEARTLDLIEEIGELCNAVLVKERYKSKKRAKIDLSDSMADILFDIILLADYYKVDIDKEYSKMIKDLKKRQKRREFN